jgi:nitrous oxidase accessory protein NosD
VTNSTVRNIGEVPFNGAQHGNAVVYINGASGTISGNTLFDYQKNGITVSGMAADGVTPGSKTKALVLNNVVIGEGPITYIAQNGIQISFGATATVKGNSVSGDNYTPTSNVACGLLFYQAAGVKASNNNLFNNEVNLCNVGRGGGHYNP